MAVRNAPLYEQGIDEGDLVVLTENHLYKKWKRGK